MPRDTLSAAMSRWATRTSTLLCSSLLLLGCGGEAAPDALEYRRYADLQEGRMVSATEYQRARAALAVLNSEVKLWETRVAFGDIMAPRDGVLTARVRPGFLARLRITVDERSRALAVPSAALGEDGDERYVYLVHDERLERRRVEPGVTRGEWTEIRAGLEPGDIVLATNPIDMRDGQRVRIVGWRG